MNIEDWDVRIVDELDMERNLYRVHECFIVNVKDEDGGD